MRECLPCRDWINIPRGSCQGRGTIETAQHMYVKSGPRCLYTKNINRASVLATREKGTAIHASASATILPRTRRTETRAVSSSTWLERTDNFGATSNSGGTETRSRGIGTLVITVGGTFGRKPLCVGLAGRFLRVFAAWGQFYLWHELERW